MEKAYMCKPSNYLRLDKQIETLKFYELRGYSNPKNGSTSKSRAQYPYNMKIPALKISVGYKIPYLKKSL